MVILLSFLFLLFSSLLTETVLQDLLETDGSDDNDCRLRTASRACRSLAGICGIDEHIDGNITQINLGVGTFDGSSVSYWLGQLLKMTVSGQSYNFTTVYLQPSFYHEDQDYSFGLEYSTNEIIFDSLCFFSLGGSLLYSCGAKSEISHCSFISNSTYEHSLPLFWLEIARCIFHNVYFQDISLTSRSALYLPFPKFMTINTAQFSSIRLVNDTGSGSAIFCGLEIDSVSLVLKDIVFSNCQCAGTNTTGGALSLMLVPGSGMYSYSDVISTTLSFRGSGMLHTARMCMYRVLLILMMCIC